MYMYDAVVVKKLYGILTVLAKTTFLSVIREITPIKT